MLACAASVVFAPIARAQGESLVRDTEIEAILHEEADPVFKAAGLNPRDVKLHLVGQNILQAAATPGQNMLIYTGLIQETKNPNQLIGVIAHETGHIAGGHMVRSGEMEKAGLKPFLLTMGLGILAAAAGAPDAAAVLMGSASQFGTLGMLGYSREQEARADQAAITYLQKANISSKGLVDFFDNFRYEEVFSEARRFPFFQSHPISSERIELLRRRAEEQPAYDKVDSPEALAKHAIMKAKLDAFMNPPGLTLAKYKESDTGYPARYARAIAHYKALDTALAIRDIDALLVDQPTNPYLWELKGQVLFESGRPKEAEAPHRRSVELMPDAPLLRVNLAQTLIAQNDKAKTDDAINVLEGALAVEGDNTFAWRLMAQARDSKGENGAARLAAAEEHFSVGDMTQARIFAMRARELLPKNTPEWRRATDIVLVAEPSKDDLKAIGGNG
ncbi:MAG TPA: M48 family metalloprotease [Caulobacteraceae bacterium]|jgi:predicted Zn-dependent protease|nr:M48 family metalloprotease [Caulobacteraceae bacterium]